MAEAQRKSVGPGFEPGCTNVPGSYDQYGLRSGGKNWVCIWSHWMNETGNLEEERTQYANQVESGKCDGDPSF